MSEQLNDKYGFCKFHHTDDLPEKWDDSFGVPGLFCHRRTLAHLLATSPLQQEYFSLGKVGLRSINGVVCRSNLPFAVGPITFYRPATICSLPMPFSTDPGFSDVGRVNEVATIMDRFNGGFQVITGLGSGRVDIPGWSWRRHYPTVDLDIRWGTFEEYHDSFRTDYKSRITETLEAGREIKQYLLSPDRFTPKEHALYAKVAKRYNSLVLPVSFFTEFPEENYILGLELNGSVEAWALLVPKNKYMYFLFGGFSEKLNSVYRLYNNLLLAIVRFSIENKYKRVNLGQTAELSKMRVGGLPLERYQLVRHTNPLINLILQKTDIFEYRKHYPTPNVFKNNGK